ncbi:MAG: PQQ-dependent sugar dehydrogenase [Candidatus Sumerlaeia bacterium]|nr:PQQ-dependent sugar dehydrogenase [Candidatus Sumerlaeia bacterium]
MIRFVSCRTLLPAFLLATSAGVTVGDEPTFELERVYPQLSFTNMVHLQEIPDGSERRVVVTKSGRIHVFPNNPDPDPADVSLFLDISDRVWDSGERGLFSIAFSPDYTDSGEFYVSYVTTGGQGVSRISRFTHEDISTNTVDASTEEIIYSVSQDFSNHNNGMVEFGPDGMLYIGFGDGGSGDDPLNRAQDTTSPLGSILRIDVLSEPADGDTYVIPADNPFVDGGPDGTDTLPEMYAYGLRNPWRFSHDPVTGFLYAGDVGQVSWEEVNIIVSGGNYGWREVEGSECNPTFPNCTLDGTILPIAEYVRGDLGISITGGYVSRTPRVPGLEGHYVFGDFGSGRLFALEYTGVEETVSFEIIAEDLGFNIASFGYDLSGDVYTLAFGSSGGIYRFVGEDPEPTAASGVWKLY